MKNVGADPWSMAAIEYHGRWLKPFVLATVGDRAAVDDILQEVFCIAYEKRESFMPGTNFGAWLRGIARNCVRRYYEKRKRVPVVTGEALVEVESEADRWERNLMDKDWYAERIHALRECLARIENKARRVLEERYSYGKSAEDVAHILKITLSAVYSLAFRTREALARCVKGKLAEGTSE